MAAQTKLKLLASRALTGAAGTRLDKLLPQLFPEVSRRLWRTLIDAGAVRRNDDTTRVAGKLVMPLDVLELHLGRVRLVTASAAAPICSNPSPPPLPPPPPRALAPDELSTRELEALIVSAADAEAGRPQPPSAPPRPGGGAELELPFAVPLVCMAPPPLEILYLDKSFMVINKKGGVLCQSAEDRSVRVARETAPLSAKGAAAATGAPPSAPPQQLLAGLAYEGMPLVDQAAWWLAHREGVVGEFLHMYHRLDRGASGAVLFVRNRALLPRLDEAWDAGSVARTYVAVVQGVPAWASRVCRAPIGRAPGVAWRFEESPAGKPARTAVRVLATGGGGGSGVPPFAVVEAAPQTGRTHQIRVHLAACGHPIVGDVLYGADVARWPLVRPPPAAPAAPNVPAAFAHRLLLHSRALRFLQPVRHHTLNVEAGYPRDVASYVAAATPVAAEGAAAAGLGPRFEFA